MQEVRKEKDSSGKKQKASRSLRAAGLLFLLLSTKPVLILKEAG
jgi:hypothetical protein